MKHRDQVHLGFQLTEERFRAEHYGNLLDNLLDPEATLPPDASNSQESSPEEMQTQFEALAREVRGLVEAVNESVASALESDDVAARKSAIEAARAKIVELRDITPRHPSVELQRLDEVMSLIDEIDRESAEL
jgi:hypothetical protein